MTRLSMWVNLVPNPLWNWGKTVFRVVYIHIHTYIHHTHTALSFTHITALLLQVFMPINAYEEESKRGYPRGLQCIMSPEEKRKKSLDWANQAPLSMVFSRQEYWNGLPFLTPGDLPHPGIEPVSPALAGWFFTAEPAGKSRELCQWT